MNREPKVFTDGNSAIAFCASTGVKVRDKDGFVCHIIRGTSHTTRPRTCNSNFAFWNDYAPFTEILDEPSAPELPELSTQFKDAFEKYAGYSIGASPPLCVIYRALLVEVLRLARAMVEREYGLKPRGES